MNDAPAEAVTVSESGISVTKEFVPDEFPVPTVRFTIRSDRDRPVRARIVDEIPERFPVDSVGFHPEYLGDHWNGYEDHRVEFDRELDPGESVVTLYGVRVDDHDDAREFMGEPELAVGPPDTQPDDEVSVDTDVAGDTDTDEVSVELDVADETRDGPTEMDVDRSVESDDPQGGLSTDSSDPLPPELDDDEDDGIDISIPSIGEEGTGVDGIEEPAAPAETPPNDAESAVDAERQSGEADPVTDVETDTARTGSPDQPGSSDVEAEDGTEAAATEADAGGRGSDQTPAAGGDGSVAARLATELRNGEVSDDDREVLREELQSTLQGGSSEEFGVTDDTIEQIEREMTVGPEAVDVDAIREAVDATSVPSTTKARVDHLQSRVENLAAYTEAVDEFLDEEGTAQEVIRRFKQAVADVADDVEDLRERIGDTTADVEDVHDDVSVLEARADDLDDRIDRVAADLSTEVDEAERRIDDNEEGLGAVRSTVDEVADDVESLSTDLEDVENSIAETEATVETLDERLEAAETNVDEYDDDVSTLQDEISALTEQVSASEATLEATQDEVESIRSTLDAVDSRVGTNEGDIEEIVQWRSQLGKMFSSVPDEGRAEQDASEGGDTVEGDNEESDDGGNAVEGDDGERDDGGERIS